MGGKLWSPDEEKYFWEVIIPNSKFRTNPAVLECTWEELASKMQAHFGNNARRAYNEQLLAEHFYQNTRYEQASPNATAYVSRYISQYRISFGQDPPQGQRIGGVRRQNKARYRKAATTGASTATAASEAGPSAPQGSVGDVTAPTASEADGQEEDLFVPQDEQPDVTAAEHEPSAFGGAIGAEAQPTRIEQEGGFQGVGPVPGPGPQGRQHGIAPVQYPQLPHQGHHQQQGPAPAHDSQQQQHQVLPPLPPQGVANNRRQLPLGPTAPAQGPEPRRQYHQYQQQQQGFAPAPAQSLHQQQQAPQQGFGSGYGSRPQHQPRQLQELDAQQQQNYQPYQPHGASVAENDQAYLQNYQVAPARFPSPTQLRGPADYGTLPQPGRGQHYGPVPPRAHPQNLQHPQRPQGIPSAPGPQRNPNQPATYVGPHPYQQYGVTPPGSANPNLNLAQGGFPPPRPEPRVGNDTHRPPPWQSGGIIEHEDPDRTPPAAPNENRIVLPPISPATAQRELDLGHQRQEQRSQQPTPTPDSTVSRLLQQQAPGHVQDSHQGHPLYQPSITRPSPAQRQQMQQRQQQQRNPLPMPGLPRLPQFPPASAFRMPATSYYDPQAQRTEVQPDQTRPRRSPQPMLPSRPVTTGPRPSLNLGLEPAPPSPPEPTRRPVVVMDQLERSLSISNEAVAAAAVAALAAANPRIFDSRPQSPAEGDDK